MTKHYTVGDHVDAHALTAVSGTSVPVPDQTRLVHMQFARFAGCPICTLHLRPFVTRAGDIDRAGIREVVVFHSSAADLRQYEPDLPFDIIPDPDKRLYAEFGVGASRRSVMHPAVLLRMFSLLPIARGRKPPADPAGGKLGLPADLLIAPDGTVLAAHYGTHALDQWSVADLLALAAGAVAPA